MKTLQKIITLFFVLCGFSGILAQEKTTNSEVYEIAGLKVSGNEYAETQAILARSGLALGQRIYIPSNTIPKAIKSIWKMALFADVQIIKEKTVEDLIFLKIVVVEHFILGNVKIQGIKKTRVEELEKIIVPHLNPGSVLSNHKRKITLALIEEYYSQKGYQAVNTTVEEIPNRRNPNSIDLIYHIDPGTKTKIQDIIFSGNEAVKTGKLLRLMSSKRKKNILKSSKFVFEQIEEDKIAITDHYHTLGYRDAKVITDSIWQEEDNDWIIALKIEEGPQFYIGEVTWHGNTIYSNADLQKVFGLKKGDIFNPTLIESRLRFDERGRDISSLYLDNGYLFFKVEKIEKAIHENVIDLEIRINEGTQATINKVIINGNTTTHEEVIRRELRTQPGDKFSRSDIIRSQRELINLGFFNPQNIAINTPVDPSKGTVDIEYIVEEKNADQLELAASYGGADIGLTGTLGVAFNNFSFRNILKPETWSPLPSGDGQKLSFRAQTNGQEYQSFNMSFTEPWLGGKRPQSFSVSSFYNIDNEDGIDAEVDGERFSVFGLSVGLSRRLQWGDQNLTSTSRLSWQRYKLQDWGDDLFIPDEGGSINNGIFHKISFSHTLTRNTLNHNFFPTSGSRVSLTTEFTPPYSLFRQGNEDQSLEEKYQWIEYHKWRFKAEAYRRVIGKLTFKAGAKFGALGSYNSSTGISPFERFQLGGNGLSSFNNGYSGTDIISLRGYEVEDLENNIRDGEIVANPLFNKFTLELRYPVMTNPVANMYVLGFLEGGNSYQSWQDYNPFDLKRSAGIGLRAQIPMLGLIGFDYGIGFDKEGDKTLKNFGQFSLIFGFEPE